MYVFHNHVVNAVTAAILGRSAGVRDSIAQHEPAADVAYPALANRNVGYKAIGAKAAVSAGLVLGRQQNREAGLGKAGPVVLQNVAFEQNPLRILEFKQVLDDKRIAVEATHESGLSFQPGHGLEHVIAANFDITGRSSGLAASQQNDLTGGF